MSSDSPLHNPRDQFRQGVDSLSGDGAAIAAHSAPTATEAFRGFLLSATVQLSRHQDRKSDGR
jgi:hypothetical protein